MNAAQVATLKHFDETERRLDGLPINWAVADYRTFHALDVMRDRIDAPIHIIRETHPNRPFAVDGTCPTVPLSYVFMGGLERIPGASFGLYAGNSWHIDFRDDDHRDLWPARWMAVKPLHRPLLKERGLMDLIEKEKDGWIYLLWNHPKSFVALSLVFELSEHGPVITEGGGSNV